MKTPKYSMRPQRTKMHNGDTIAAVSTPPGKGGVALIRCSGAEAFEIARRCFTSKSGKDIEEFSLRHAIYGHICNGAGEAIDDGILTLFPASSSYTGENVAEISCHGGVLVTRAVLQAVLEAGARPAAAGEFTRRAFLNGRLSLYEAEAIGDLLEAVNDNQMRLSSVSSRKRLREAVKAITDEMTHLVSSLYALIDFPDEDLSEMSEEEILASLQHILESLSRLASTYRTGRAISEGIETVICGRPNVGKSSLYNALCGEELAIVTSIAGTTRDLLSETVSAGRVTLRLTDTAGIRHADQEIDEVEKIGIRRAEQALEQAELVLAVFDSSEPLTQEDLALIHNLKEKEKTVIAILNKADLPYGIDRTEIDALTPHVLSLSVQDDLSALHALIEELCIDRALSTGADAILFDARHFAAVTRATDYVRASYEAFCARLPADLAFQDIELAIGALEELDGRGVTNALVDHIFSRFCVGK